MSAESGKPFLERDRAKIGRQIVLPLGKAVEIAMKSLRIRFWRSMITMAGIILAIAFLMSIWSANAYVNGFKALDTENPDRGEIILLLQRQGINLDEAESGLSARQKWLIVLSLLVCVVGIVNAMLMSVAERVREIGTMKCLGALDGFIIKLFLLESSFQGISGTVFGIVVGFILTFVRSLISYRLYSITYFPVMGILESALLSFVVGSILSVFAAMWPAYSAARMQPVEAMRSER
jgi:ABC-type antimicrobial peptide transport system permease subunit